MAAWTDDEIQIIRDNWKSKTHAQLAELIPNHPRDSIRKKMKDIGIRLSKEDRSWRCAYAHSFVDYNNICRTDQSVTFDQLGNLQIQVLLGSMLGDGCVNKQSPNLRNYNFIESHCLAQSDYLRWKMNILSDFKPRMSANMRSDYPSVRLIAKTHPIFTFLRGKFYSRPLHCSKDIIPLDLMERLDLLGLLIWYLDDGHYRPSPGYRMNIAAKGWNENELRSLVDAMNSKLAISMYMKVYEDGNKFVKIPFKDKAILDRWKQLAISIDLPACMHYKLANT